MANLLAELIRVPAALIMLFSDPDIEVFISSNSEGNPYHLGDKEKLLGSGLYCETVIKTQNRLFIPNALEDKNWEKNPDIKLNMISYLGFPIMLPNNRPFGTLCVLDSKANDYSITAETLMLQFRSLIESHLEMIYMNQILGEKNRRLTDYLAEIQALRGFVTMCANCKSIKDEKGDWNPIESYLIHNPEADFSHSICPKCLKDLYPNFNETS